MGGCQSKPTVVVTGTKNLPDNPSVISGSASASNASESTVTISNTNNNNNNAAQQQQQNVVGQAIKEDEAVDNLSWDSDAEANPHRGLPQQRQQGLERSSSSSELSSSSPPGKVKHHSSPSKSRSSPSKSRSSPSKKKKKSKKSGSSSSKRKVDPDGGYSSPTHRSPRKSQTKRDPTPPTTNVSDSDDSSSSEHSSPRRNKGTTKLVTMVGAPEPRQLWSPEMEDDKAIPRSGSSSPPKKSKSKKSLSSSSSTLPALAPPIEEDETEEGDAPAAAAKTPSATITPSSTNEKGSSSNSKQRSSGAKNRKIGFSPIRTTIPEEEDPEMPSDEEDFREDLVRNTPKDEPGRLVPVKLKTQPTTSVASVVVAGGTEAPPVLDLAGGDKNAVHLHTLSEFQRLKLQVKLQKHQEMKERRVHKVEDRVHDAESYRKLWQEYQKTEEDLAKLEQELPKQPSGRSSGMRRNNSFDLKDSGSWFFDFQSPDAKLELPPEASADDNGSQASLSLLSEASLDAQKRYYAEKRRKRKEKKRQSKLEKKQQKRQAEGSASAGPPKQPMQPPGQRLEGATTPEGLARLNMANSAASGATRDYGPVRDQEPTTPLDVEVSFQYGGDRYGPTDDAGSYVSDLGDESLGGGGFAGGGSQSGYSQPHSHMWRDQNSMASGNNDYGVKRRIRAGGGRSGYTQKDHETMQAKLKSLEQSLAQMQQSGGAAASTKDQEEQVGDNDTVTDDGDNHSTPKAGSLAGGAATAVESSSSHSKRQPDGYAGVPLNQMLSAAEKKITLPPSRRRRKTEDRLAEQIQEAILAASTPTRKTRKSRKKGKKSTKQQEDEEEPQQQHPAAAHAVVGGPATSAEPQLSQEAPEDQQEMPLATDPLSPPAAPALSAEEDAQEDEIPPIVPATEVRSPLESAKKSPTKKSALSPDVAEDVQTAESGSPLNIAGLDKRAPDESPLQAQTPSDDTPLKDVDLSVPAVVPTETPSPAPIDSAPTSAESQDSPSSGFAFLRGAATSLLMMQTSPDDSMQSEQSDSRRQELFPNMVSPAASTPDTNNTQDECYDGQDESGSCGDDDIDDDDSDATGPQAYDLYDAISRDGTGVESDSPLAEKNLGPDFYNHEEKKEDPHAESVSEYDEDDTKSKASSVSVHDPFIHVLSKDQFLNISYKNPVADAQAFRQETDDEDNNPPSDEDIHRDYATPSPKRKGSPTSPGASSFWRDELEQNIRSFIPERTDVLRDSFVDEVQQNINSFIPERTDMREEQTRSGSTPLAVVTPDSAGIRPGGVWGADDDEEEESLSGHNDMGLLPDPDGRRIELDAT